MIIKELYLLMPVYKGEKLFLEAINSLEDSEYIFKSIIISFNGLSNADMLSFQEFLKLRNCKNKYILFETNQDLTSIKHAQFINVNIKNIIEDSSYIMLMAHDDILDSSSNISQMIKAAEKFPDKTIIFPEYITENIEKKLKIVKPVTRENWFWLTYNKNYFFNMSGIILSGLVFKSAIMNFKYKRSGAFVEYLLATNQGNDFVSHCSFVRVKIKERAESDGASIVSFDSRVDEIAYLLSNLSSCRSLTEFLLLFFYVSRKIAIIITFNIFKINLKC